MTSNTSNAAVAIATPATMLQTDSSTSAHQQSAQPIKKSSDASVKASKKSQKNASKEPSATASAKQTKAANKAAKADSKGDASHETNTTKKSKAAAAAAAAESSSTNNGATADTSSSKKHASRQQPFKISRDKERKEKQQKQTAALTSASPTASNTSKSKGAARESSSSSSSSTSCASTTTNTRASTGSTALSRLQEMEQDGVKSRNHRLFLAPPSARSSGPCWSGRRLARATRADSVADRLHDEILDYAKYTRATVDAMTVHIEQMMTHVRRCVHTLWPKSQMEPFGSYSTGIWLPSSDVDLVILGVVEIHDRMLTIKSLRQLARALDKQPWVESLVVLDTAKIPVLKLVTAESSVPIDITFESTATHSGLLARDLIKRYADEMPELYPLAVVFKQLLRERDLNDAYTGGLSSYSVVLMIVHFQLLWRYGDRCFRAAAVFASGSPLPRPADLIAEEEREKQRERELEQELEKDQVESPSQAPANAWGKTDDKTAMPTITSSFAAVVTRSTSLKRPASEAGRTLSSSTDAGATSDSKPPATPFSYAAVAAGIAKLSTDEASAAKKNTASAPSSYAAAVAAPAPQVVKIKTKTASASSNASGTKKKSSDADSVSVTSSTADTEDSASLSDSKSTTSAHDDESSSSSTQPTTRSAKEPLDQDDQEPATELSLGERTMTILEFFGIIFDYRKNGLSIRDGGYIYRLADHVGASGDLCKKLPALVIEDPIHPDRNVSASSFAFSKVVAVFEDSFYALKYFRPTRYTPSALSCLLSTSGHSLHQYQLQQQQHQQQQLDLRRLKTKARTPTSSPVKAQAQAVAAK